MSLVVGLVSYEVVKKKAGRGHAYYIDGKKVPRVTNILKTVVSKGGGFERWLQMDAIERFQKLIRDNPGEDYTTQPAGQILSWSKPAHGALDRGSAVHLALETEDFDHTKHHPAAQAYVRAAARFFEEERPEILERELVVGSRELGYAGTLDARATWAGAQEHVLLDYKTASKPGTEPYLEYHLQLAAYELACQEMGYLTTDRQVIVMLYPDGDYAKFTVQATPDDWRAAMSWYQGLASAKERIAA